MPQGTFNISNLLNRLGLKNVVEMPMAGNIQTVLPLRTMAGAVPCHTGRLAMWGGASPAVPGEYAAFEFVSVDPGGSEILAILQANSAVQVVVVTSGSPIAWAATGPINHPAQQFGSELSASSYWSGTVLGPPSTLDPFIVDIQPGLMPPLFLSHGQRLKLTSRAAGVAQNMTVIALGISATQAEPS